MSFRITGLPADQFSRYLAMTDEELKAMNIEPVIADDSKPGFPCRVSLADAAPDERLILINFEHLPTASAYRSAHAIYVAENSDSAYNEIDKIPEPIRERDVSIRAFDAQDMMIDADITDGAQAKTLISRLFDDPQAAYLHIHYAKRGCFAARVDRAS